MTPLTGAGEQRGAEVIDEQSGARSQSPVDGFPEQASPSEQTTIQIPAQHAAADAPKRPPTFEALGTWTLAHGTLLRRVALGLAISVVAVTGYVGLQKLADAPAEPGAPGNTAQPQTSSTPDEAAEEYAGPR